MFDPELYNSYPEEIRESIDGALMVLAQTEILLRQVTLERARVVEGDGAESVEELAKKILRVRADTQGLLLIHNHGLSLLKEQNDA